MLLAFRNAHLYLYRRVIEIRDAILILRDYVTPDTVHDIDQFLKQRASCGDTKPLVTACWLQIARHHMIRGTPPPPHALNTTELGGDNLDSEVKFLLKISNAWHTPSAASRASSRPGREDISAPTRCLSCYFWCLPDQLPAASSPSVAIGQVLLPAHGGKHQETVARIAGYGRCWFRRVSVQSAETATARPGRDVGFRSDVSPRPSERVSVSFRRRA